MSDDYARVLNIIGLACNLIGVLILFRWGMPFRVESHGQIGYIAEQTDKQALALDLFISGITVTDEDRPYSG